MIDLNNLRVEELSGESFTEQTKAFKIGDTAYIIESNRLIRETVIIRKNGSFYTVKFKDTKGAITLKAHRLYQSREQAEEDLPERLRKTKRLEVKGPRPPHRFLW